MDEVPIPPPSAAVRQPRWHRLGALKTLGPGFIAGAADNDPTTVASLAVVGSTTGLGLAWLVLLLIPMLAVIQMISAAIGAVSSTGLVGVLRRRYGGEVAGLALILVLAVNVITLAADLEGGAAALGLLTGWPYQWLIVPFAVVVGIVLVRYSYVGLQRLLSFILLVFLAYVAAAVLARPDWDQVLLHSVVPHFSLSSPDDVAGALSLLGTTLTSYVYIWETIQVAAERAPTDRLRLVQFDAAAGMIATGIIFYFILIGTATTLGVHHHSVQTAQDAAAALAPLAGRFSSVLFGVGLLASAALAVPVLAGTSAYVLAEAFGWGGNLDERFAQAPAFYVTLLLSLVVGVGITSLGVGPIRILFFGGIVGGLATPITMGLLLLAARDRRVMGAHPVSGWLAIAGWLVTLTVTAACAIYLWHLCLPL
jgi:Mn2+/Fe2+ NRAMP family transporter